MTSSIVVPTLFWVCYHYYRDRHQQEPIRLALLALLLGGVAGALGQGLYWALHQLDLARDPYQLSRQDLLGLLVYCLAVIGFIEEIAKLIPFLLIVVRLKHFDEPIDGVIYASFIGLGFAAFENLLHMDHLSSTEQVLRGISSPLVHMMFASLWGYPVGLAVLAGNGLLRAIAIGLTTSICIHGVYDFLVIGLPPYARFAAALLICVVWLRRMYLLEHRLAPNKAKRLS